MKTKLKSIIYLCISLIILFSIKCKKDELVKVTKLETGSVTDVTYTSAKVSATFSDLSGNVAEFGHCWNTSGDPQPSQNKYVVSGTAQKEEYTSDLIDLTGGTTYFVRAYAIDGGTIVFGKTIEFDTESYGLPTITTNVVSDLTDESATCGGEITNDGGQPIISKGVCWSTGHSPTISDDKTNDGTGNGAFTSSLNGLTESTVYYVRAYATNSVGTAYGEERRMETTEKPYIEIQSPSETDSWEAGKEYSISWTDNIDDNVKIELYRGGNLSETITTSTESDGSYSWSIPKKITYADNYILKISSVDNADIFDESGQFDITEPIEIIINVPDADTEWFMGHTYNIEWTDNIDETVDIKLFKNGVEVTTYGNIATNTPSDGVYGWIVPLHVDANDYTIKIISTSDPNIVGESDVFSIVAQSGATGTVNDFDNNTYNTIKIGNQWWMAENLNVTHYANGAEIPLIVDNSSWAALGDNNTDKAYCFYNNNSSNESSTYGALYTWAAVMNGVNSSTDNPSGVLGVCPTGWHIPSTAEWIQLIEYVGGTSVAGAKLKESGTIHWTTPNSGIDEFGFTALPGGLRDPGGNFSNLNLQGNWWSATQANDSYVIFRYMTNTSDEVSNSVVTLKSNGFSVRCVRD